MKKILVIDDSHFAVQTIKNCLRGKYEVSAVCLAKHALEIVRVEKPDLILLDIMMPEINGIDLLKEIQIDLSMRAIPVIMLTFISNIETESECLKLGARDFVRKPFNTEMLISRIENALKYMEC
jgi:DNA-binding response OmpR family regulator